MRESPGCSDCCDCCAGIEAVTPLPIANRPGLPAISYRVGTHAAFLETMLSRLTQETVGDDPGADGADRPCAPIDARPGRPCYRVPGRLGDRRRRAELLPGADRQRGLPAYRDRAAVRSRAGPPGRVPVAARRRGRTVSRLHPGRPTAQVTLEVGSKVQSVPGPGELPQTFETSTSRPRAGSGTPSTAPDPPVDPADAVARRPATYPGWST